jgi:hypothetical protein
MGRRSQRRRPDAGLAQRGGGTIATLVLRRGGGASIHGRRGVDGTRRRPCAVEALRDALLIVDGREHGGSAGTEGEGARGREAVEGVGRVGRGAHDLAEGEGCFGAVGLDGRAQRGVLEGRRRGRELEPAAPGRAHDAGVVRRERHGEGRGWRRLRELRLTGHMSQSVHGTCYGGLSRRCRNGSMQAGRPLAPTASVSGPGCH